MLRRKIGDVKLSIIEGKPEVGLARVLPWKLVPGCIGRVIIVFLMVPNPRHKRSVRSKRLSELSE